MGKAGHWAIALVCVVLGFMLSMQFKVQQKVDLQTVVLERAQDAAQRLVQVEKERGSLQGEVTELRQQVDQLLRSQSDSATLSRRLAELELAAGLTDVVGPGVIVRLEDSKRPFRPGESPNAYILHDEDLLRVVNELRAAGAEAISLNGQRITARSEIRCSGPTVTVNGVRTAPPVEIRSIGDPKMLEAALKLRGGPVDNLALWGIEVRVTAEPRVQVPGLTGAPAFLFAQPAQRS